MKPPWFTKAGWTYRPTSLLGWVIAAAVLAFCVHIFLFVDGRSHSTSDTLYGVFPFVVPAFLLYHWIASENA